MTSELAILALHACRVFEEVTTKCTAHDVVELLQYKFMSVKLMDFLLALSYGAFSVETDIERPAILHLFCYIV